MSLVRPTLGVEPAERGYFAAGSLGGSIIQEGDLMTVKVNPREIQQWAKELEESTAKIPADEHDRLEQALEEIERESKDAVRREWGLE